MSSRTGTPALEKRSTNCCLGFWTLFKFCVPVGPTQCLSRFPIVQLFCYSWVAWYPQLSFSFSNLHMYSLRRNNNQIPTLFPEVTCLHFQYFVIPNCLTYHNHKAKKWWCWNRSPGLLFSVLQCSPLGAEQKWKFGDISLTFPYQYLKNCQNVIF